MHDIGVRARRELECRNLIVPAQIFYFFCVGQQNNAAIIFECPHVGPLMATLGSLNGSKLRSDVIFASVATWSPVVDEVIF
jgi:hypothetical protein